LILVLAACSVTAVHPNAVAFLASLTARKWTTIDHVLCQAITGTAEALADLGEGNAATPELSPQMRPDFAFVN